MIASVADCERRRRAIAQALTGFFASQPSRRRNSHTALCEIFTPRAARSFFSPCNVRCGTCSIRSMMNPRCGSSTDLRRAHLSRRDRSRRAMALRPLRHRRNHNAEPRRHRSAALDRQNRPYGAFTKIIRKRSSHQMLANQAFIPKEI